MKKSLLTLALVATLSASAFAADQYLVRVPANVNLSAAAPETPQEPISLSLSAEALPSATVNEPYSFNLLDRLTITGGSGSHNYSDTAWSLKAGDVLPPGLSLSGSMIAGTPTAKNETGTSFEVTGTYQDASGQQVYTIVINGIPLNVTQISAGSNHTCAVTIEGAAKCWGDNSFGQLGNGSTASSAAPTQVISLLSNISSISAGDQYTCALTESGRAKCWGKNENGQIGDGSTISRLLPVDVIGLTSDIEIIEVGIGHSCAISIYGSAKCWGNNSNGQLGDKSTIQRLTPVDVEGLGVGVKSISTGSSHTCAIMTSGGAKCWGGNYHGMLGDGSKTDRAIPVDVSGLTTGVISISSGHQHTCAVTAAGASMCWGRNHVGQLGNNSTIERPYPINVIGLSNDSNIIIASHQYTCAKTKSGNVKCWGWNGYGQLGDGSTAEKMTPVDVIGFSSGVSDITSGKYHACALKPTGISMCWGLNDSGQLGNGTTTSQLNPVIVTK